MQIGFLALNLWIGFEFYHFVRAAETGDVLPVRPPGVEGWLPIAGLMNLKSWALTGQVPALHPAALFLLLVFLAISLLLRKAFCSWLCPVGTVSELLWKFGRKTFNRNWALPRWLDIPLRGLKYLLLGFFGWAVGWMSVETIQSFMDSPYGLLVDVKMLDLFRHMGVTTAVVIGILTLLSFFIQNVWCRYLCPYGALMGLVSLLSPARIRREVAACIDCGKCAKACPSQLKVDQLIQIRSAECIGCMECVASCPAEGALAMKMTRRRAVPAWAVATVCLALFGSTVWIAEWTGHWDSPISAQTYRLLIPRLSELAHPR